MWLTAPHWMMWTTKSWLQSESEWTTVQKNYRKYLSGCCASLYMYFFCNISSDKRLVRWPPLWGKGCTAGRRLRSSQVLLSSTTRAFPRWSPPSTSTPASWVAEPHRSSSSCLTTWTTWTKAWCLESCNVRVHSDLFPKVRGLANNSLNSQRLWWGIEKQKKKINPHDNWRNCLFASISHWWRRWWCNCLWIIVFKTVGFVHVL